MKKNIFVFHDTIAAAIIVILSITAITLWLLEILEIKGWYGLNWLSGKLYSPYIGTLIVVFAFMTPFIVSRQTTTRKIILPTIILYSVSVFCFEVGKGLFYALYCQFCSWRKADIALMFGVGFVLFLFLAIAYWFVTDKLIKKNKKINILIIALLLLLVVPLSLMTIQINTGFGSGTDWVDTVKMGYPVFWTTIILGLIGLIIARQPNLKTPA